MQAVLCGHVLMPDSRDRLIGWLNACETGRERLRAGLPADWIGGRQDGHRGRRRVQRRRDCRPASASAHRDRVVHERRTRVEAVAERRARRNRSDRGGAVWLTESPSPPPRRPRCGIPVPTAFVPEGDVPQPFASVATRATEGRTSRRRGVRRTMKIPWGAKVDEATDQVSGGGMILTAKRRRRGGRHRITVNAATKKNQRGCPHSWG